MVAWLSVLGMYNNYPDIFDDMALPDGVEKSLVIYNIITELAELGLLYTSPIVLKPLISVWSQTEKYNWQKLFDTMNFDYNPIDNYDRTEEETSTDNRNTNGSARQNATQTNDLLVSSDNMHKVAGFNAETLVNSDSDAGSVNNSGTVQNDIESTSSTTDTNTNIRNMRAHGNIGVTTTQEMIKQEREISEFNIYKYITESFKHRFCLMVY